MRWLSFYTNGRSTPAAVAADASIVDLREAARLAGEAAPRDLLEVIQRPQEGERLQRLVGSRRLQARDPFFDWLAGKWFDGFAPCGPWIVTADEIPDPYALGIRLSVNGVLRQQGSTADMIFDVPAVIAAASAIMTLEPGAIIATGTPAGAGLGTGESSLRAGDQVVWEIDRIGTLRSTIGTHA
jgi:hypothetical protein